MATETVAGFDQFDLAEPILKAVREVGYETPSPIQRQAIKSLLEGRDVLGQAQTGTGKTAAFALPVLSRIDLSRLQPQVLVLTPTRELALQVAEAMQTYARYLRGFHVLPVYGGQAMGLQLRQLKRGVHVVVGTPGRIQDHLRRRTLDLKSLKTVVIDEADEMLRMGFIDEVESILSHMPQKKQVALFSATMPAPIEKITQRYLNDAVEIKIKSKTATVDTITQRYWLVRGMHKLDALTRILEAEEFVAMLVFVRTRISTVDLAEKLEARGFASAALNGDMTQAMREQTVDRLKNGKLDIVVATDVAARGLDVDRISHVINYDIPHDVEGYVHRIGRTGRAGRQGQAILFVAPRERRMLRSIERVTKQPIEEMHPPTRENVVERRLLQFRQSISAAIKDQDLEYFEKIVASVEQETETPPHTLAAALAYLVQKERPLQFSAVRPEAERQERRERGPSRQKGRDKREARYGERKKYAATRERDSRSVPEGSLRYRIAVGHDHDVQPGNIVGAIANEAELDAEHIGHIRIYGDYSTVDLPEGMPGETFRKLQKAWVCGQQLAIRPEDDRQRETGAAKTRKKGTLTPGKAAAGKRKPGRLTPGKAAAGKRKPGKISTRPPGHKHNPRKRAKKPG
jgi:ATP-dependent RNA helicase DeaD